MTRYMTPADPVDEILPLARMIALGIQHVLVVYAGPLILGCALKLSPEDVSFLIFVDLFVYGFATTIQCFGLIRYVGLRQRVMMGVTLALVRADGGNGQCQSGTGRSSHDLWLDHLGVCSPCSSRVFVDSIVVLLGLLVGAVLTILLG